MVESAIESGSAPAADPEVNPGANPGDDIVTDVVVLGGGLAGLTMAAALATAGEMTTLIAPAKPYDLRETPAAAALLATLHEEGFRTAWEPISGLPGVPAHHGLRIDWSPAPLPIRG